MPLRPHQIAPSASLLGILGKYRSAVDLSSMGVGKTFVAAWVAAQRKRPTLAVVPKISISAWNRASESFGDSISVLGYESLRTGRTPFGWWDDPPPPTRNIFYQCEFCQLKFDSDKPVTIPCYCHPQGIHCFDTKKKPHRYGRFHFHSAISDIIFDEVHRCGGLNSLNADMLIAAKRDNKTILGLSGTVAESPLDLRALGYVLDLHNLSNFDNWVARFGLRRIPGGGFIWMVSKEKQREIMANLRAQIIPDRGVRVTESDIPGFPECEVTTELYDIDGRIDKLYSQMAESITALREHAKSDKSPEHPLTKILRAKQEIELLKVPVALELGADFRARGFSVAYFVNYSQTIAELSKARKCDCIIDGSPSRLRKRDENINRFQTNESREIILNSEAGGVAISLQDLDGNFPRVGIVFPGFNAVTLKQLLKRLPRDGGKSKSHYRIIFAANTVEVKMHRAVAAKLNNIDALNDADLYPGNLSFSSV